MQDNPGVIAFPRRPSNSSAFASCTYLLTHPWYATTLPNKLHVQAGRDALESVLLHTRHNLETRGESAAALDALFQLIRSIFADGYVATVMVKNLPGKEDYPSVTAYYYPTWPRHTESELGPSHEWAYAALSAYIEAMSPSPA